MVVLLGSLVILAVPAYAYTRWEAPPPLTWQVALRYLLLCCACLLMSALAREDPLLVDLWPWALGVSVLFGAGLVVVLAWEVLDGQQIRQ